MAEYNLIIWARKSQLTSVDNVEINFSSVEKGINCFSILEVPTNRGKELHALLQLTYLLLGPFKEVDLYLSRRLSPPNSVDFKTFLLIGQMPLYAKPFLEIV